MNNINILKIKYGFQELYCHPWKFIFPCFYLILTYVVWNNKFYIFPFPDTSSLYDIYSLSMNIAYILFAIICFFYLIILLGSSAKSQKCTKGFIKHNFVNYIGEAPQLLSIKSSKLHSKNRIYTFDNAEIPISKWKKEIELIEQILKRRIYDIFEDENNLSLVHLCTSPPQKTNDEKILWNYSYMDKEDNLLVLGINDRGIVKKDLAVYPHILIAGSTSSGKSTLLKEILLQFIAKEYLLYIGDFKGIDFTNPFWKKNSYMIYNPNEIIGVCEIIEGHIDCRKKLFKEMNCDNIEKYIKITGEKLPRIIFAIDEISEVLDKQGVTKERKEQINFIESHLSTLARQSRAYGVHLILATQRPSADILAGEIKGNIDLRICGKTPDPQLSQIILGNTEAFARIPHNAKGTFLTNENELFKGFWVDDKDFV